MVDPNQPVQEVSVCCDAPITRTYDGVICTKCQKWSAAKDEAAKAVPAVCARRCSVCEGMDHHWIPYCDDEDPEPRMVCKHCDAVREYTDDDDEF